MRRLSEYLRTDLGDQHLVTEYCSQLKTWSQDNGEPFKEFSTTIKQMTNPANPAQHENHVHWGAGKAFIDSIREQSMKQQLHLRGNKTLNEGLRQTLELQVVKLAVWSSIRLWKQVTGHCGRTGPLPNERRDH
jgi:hypothetical protein